MKNKPCIEPLEARIAPATFTVTTVADTGPGSLRAAIVAANASPGEDTIIFQKTGGAPLKGTIEIESDLPAIEDDLVVVGPVFGKPGKLKISGGGEHGLLVISNASATISDLTLTRGSAGAFGGGGVGIFAPGESVVLDRVIISHNKAGNSTPFGSGFGGGISLVGGSLEINSSRITGNVAFGSAGPDAGLSVGAGAGGGIAALDFGSVIIRDSVVSKNVARGTSPDAETDGSAGIGGGMFASGGPGNVTIERVKFAKNKALGGNGGNGGGGGKGGDAIGGGLSVDLASGSVSVEASRFSKNVAKGGTGGSGSPGGEGGFAHGGGVARGPGFYTSITFVDVVISGNKAVGGKGDGGDLDRSTSRGGGLWAVAPIALDRSTISKNSAENGGGLHLGFGASLIASTVDQNRANKGGGIYQDQGILNAINVTVANNVAAQSGGGAFFREPAEFTLLHATISGNTAKQGGGLFASPFIGVTRQLLNTIIAANEARVDPDVSATIDATTSLIGMATGGTLFGPVNIGNIVNVNAKLGPLADNGGPTRTMMPKASSLALDAGTPPLFVAVDQRGLPRIAGPAPDIGAVERQ